MRGRRSERFGEYINTHSSKNAKCLPKKCKVPQGSKEGGVTCTGGSSEWLYEAAYSLLSMSFLIIIPMFFLHNFPFGILTIGLIQLFPLPTTATYQLLATLLMSVLSRSFLFPTSYHLQKFL